MFACGSIAHVVNVKGAFLHSEFINGEKIYTKIPLDTVLLLKKCLYKLNKQQWHFTGSFLLHQCRIAPAAAMVDNFEKKKTLTKHNFYLPFSR